MNGEKKNALNGARGLGYFVNGRIVGKILYSDDIDCAWYLGAGIFLSYITKILPFCCQKIIERGMSS